MNKNPSKTRRLGIVLAVATIIVCLLAIYAYVFSKPQIRVDCGDIRYTCFGVPVWYQRQDAGTRELLISVARSAGIQPQWAPLVTQRTSMQPAPYYRVLYSDAGIWAAQDRRLGQLLLKDISEKIISSKGQMLVYPEALFFLEDASMPGVVTSNWMEDAKIKEYCMQRGYMRPEWVKNPEK